MKMKSKIRSALACFALPLLFSAVALQAQSLPLTQTTFIRSGVHSGENYDAGGSLEVAARGGSNSRKIYLQAALDGLLHSGQQFSGSQLTLKLFSQPLLGEPSGKITLNVYGITSNESLDVVDITWDNAPENDTESASGVLATGTVLLGSITIDTDSVEAEQSFSISGANLDAYLNWVTGSSGDIYHTGDSNGIAGIIITSTGSQHDAGVSFYSNNQPTANRPNLSYELKPR